MPSHLVVYLRRSPPLFQARRVVVEDEGLEEAIKEHEVFGVYIDRKDGIPYPNAPSASRHRARICASSYTNSGVPYSSASARVSSPPIHKVPVGPTLDVIGKSEGGSTVMVGR